MGYDHMVRFAAVPKDFFVLFYACILGVLFKASVFPSICHMHHDTSSLLKQGPHSKHRR